MKYLPLLNCVASFILAKLIEDYLGDYLIDYLGDYLIEDYLEGYRWATTGY
jgi:hypothetical protein